jgi:ferric-dicitrate binding protein FerR (iron transport regulator)
MASGTDCSSIREHLPSYRTGDLDERNTFVVGSHLQACRTCMADACAEESIIALLGSIAEIKPSPRVWDRLSKETGAAPARRRLVRSLPLKVAAAASVLVAVVSFYFVMATFRPARVATVASAAPGSPLKPGDAIQLNQRFVTPAFALLSLPDVGTLKLNRDTEIVFESARRVRLERGEIFADIRPDGRGFVVESPDARVTVHGTRFGVRRDGASTVYVVDGRVEVTGRSGRLSLTDREMVTVGGAAKPLEDESLRWIAAGERPVLALTMDTKVRRTLAKGDPLDLTVRFVTNSPAPVLLPPLDDLLSKIQLRITDAADKSYLARFASSAVQGSKFRTRGTNGPVRLDVSTPCELSLRVGSDLLPAAGRVRLSVIYTPGSSRGPDFWDRDAASEPLEIEVR